MLENIRRIKTNKKKDNKNKQGIKDKGDNMNIGENTFLKLREEKLRLKEELEQVWNAPCGSQVNEKVISWGSPDELEQKTASVVYS